MADYREIAKRLVSETKNQVLTTQTHKTVIASTVGVSRQTVRKKLERDDMPLSLFIAAQCESGGDPAQAIAQALADNTTPALADGGVR